MPEVLDYRRIDDTAAFARFVAQALYRGHVVAFPTETGYAAAACALRDEAMARLLDVSDRAPELVVEAAGLRDWLPGIGAVGRKLARRFWPGPLTLACGDGAERGLAARLAPGLIEAMQGDGLLHLRHPAHEALREAMAHLPGPLALAAIPSEQGDAVNARQAIESAGDLCNLVLDDGSCRHQQPATRLELKGDDWRITRPGVLTEELIRQQLATLIVFVCTGNTCRSPLAEALCKKALADRLGCAVEQLPARGYRVLSAGMAAVAGMPAADEAVEVAKSLGADLGQHASRALTADLALQADHLLVMTNGHLRALMGHLRGAAVARLLSPDGDDIDDPIGQPLPVYESCARQMQAHVVALIEQVVPLTSA